MLTSVPVHPSKDHNHQIVLDNQFPTWTDLTANAVKNHFPDHAQATYKGHINRQLQGL